VTGAGPREPVDENAWRRHLAVASACAALGVAIHLAGRAVPVQLATVGLGVGLVGAAFMLAWAADAGESVFSGGLVLAVVALATVLPELVIEVRFAYIQATELVTANLTGATRLLLTGATVLPLAVGMLARRRGEVAPPILLGPNRRLELGMLLLAALFAIQLAVRGAVTVFDGVVLVLLYLLYTRRVQGTPEEEAAVVGVAAGLISLPQQYQRPAITALIVVAGSVVLLIANPFADALLATGTSIGIDPYILIQSVVPVATEAPEFVVVAVLVANHRPAQGMAVFLAASVSQWTLGLGSLPIAFLAGGGGISLPLAAREQLELGLTVAVTLYLVAALATLRPERFEAYLFTAVFVVNLVHHAAIVRFASMFVLLAFAIDLFISRRRLVLPLFRAVFRRRGAPE
jgi:cation:H+ antiporter